MKASLNRKYGYSFVESHHFPNNNDDKGEQEGLGTLSTEVKKKRKITVNDAVDIQIASENNYLIGVNCKRRHLEAESKQAPLSAHRIGTQIYPKNLQETRPGFQARQAI